MATRHESQVPELFELFAPLAQSDPYPLYHMLLDQGPAMETPIGVLVVGYEEASRVLKDPMTFSSDLRRYLSPMLVTALGGRSRLLEGRSMLFVDPPHHERLRGVVAKAFTPKSITALEPRVRKIAESLLAPIESKETYDIVDKLAAPLPVIVIAEMLGVSVEDRDHFKRWSDDLVAFNDWVAAVETLERAERSVEELRAYFLEEIERRRREPRDDLVGRLVAANEEGIVSVDELVSQCVLLLVAGNETTTHLVGNAVNTLGRRPDEWRRLIEEPSVIGNTVEEVLRFDGVVHATVRIPTRRTQVAGIDVEEGTPVLVVLAAAHRDPTHFADPDAFDVGRPNAAHNLGFGGGIHYCLGASLARLETRVALEVLAAKAPSFRLARPGDSVEYTSYFLRGPKRLDVLAA